MSESERPCMVALCGSLRDGSRTRIAVRADTRRSQSSAGTSTDSDRLRRHIDEADAVLSGTPNYHDSYSGTPKSTLDCCSLDESSGTTVGLLEAAAGAGPWSARVHLRTVSRTLREWTRPKAGKVTDSQSLIADDGILYGQLRQRVRRLGRKLAGYANLARYPGLTETAAAATARGEACD